MPLFLPLTLPLFFLLDELPALKDGNKWIGGFRNILNYITQVSSGKWDLDVGLSEQESADCIAYSGHPIPLALFSRAREKNKNKLSLTNFKPRFSSFLDSAAKPLLDLSLYLSQENFTTVTRPVFRIIQPFPLFFFTPDAIRSAAQSRSQNLGVDCLIFEHHTKPNADSSSRSILPESLRPRPKQTVSSILAASPEKMAQIRLNAMASNLFEPIEARRAMKKYLLSNTQMTSLDCLALGYLSLMLIPELPQAWLALNMRRQFPRLSAWVQELRTETYNGAISIRDVFDENRPTDQTHHLPWRRPSSLSGWDRIQISLTCLIEYLPGGFGQLRRDEKMRQYSQRLQKAPSQIHRKNNDEVSNDHKHRIWGGWKSVATLLSAVMAIALATAHVGLGIGSRAREETLGEKEQQGEEQEMQGINLPTFEDAGSLLGAYARQLNV